MPEPIEFTLSHMLAKQRYEHKLKEAEEAGWCVKDLFSGCDCPKCKEE